LYFVAFLSSEATSELSTAGNKSLCRGDNRRVALLEKCYVALKCA
jgi:hypothetical protein